ncbi:type II toxin-antitoxin system Phd/YefM family antitoxin [Rhodoferax sp.]|uniref:type II toxin-antitoxin system Phd/YefM family antitoxin n=1 Tax=Rhodoferax sp. TaxID=50421 RepID=UPI00276A3B16|nr:type II toxin-antitoxin system Phd/YefM family antitoxin [Rhodoferax sp.]
MSKQLDLMPTRKAAAKLRRVTSKEFRDGLAEVVEFSSRTRQPVVLTIHGKDRAALVPLEDLWLIEALELLRLRVDLADCHHAETAIWRLAEAANSFVKEYAGPGPAATAGREVKNLLFAQKPMVSAHILDRAGSSLPSERRNKRWNGCHLVREAMYEARRQGLTAEGRSILLASLMNVVKEAAEQIADSGVPSVDDMHTVIELLETVAAAIGVEDQLVQDQFARSFAEMVSRSNHEMVQCLLVWCIGELTERGKPMVALARRMAEALIASNPPDRAQQVLRILCERRELAECEALKPFISSTPLPRLPNDKRIEAVRATTSEWTKPEALNMAAMETFFETVEELVLQTAKASPLEIILCLYAARRLLGRAGRNIRAYQEKHPDVARLYVERGCTRIVNCKLKDRAVAVFVIAETLEALRDLFPKLFAQALAKMLDPREPELVHGIVVCMAEGVEGELAAWLESKHDKRIHIPRFEFVRSATKGMECIFHPGNTDSDFSDFWIALARFFSNHVDLGTMSPLWVNERLITYEHEVGKAA